MQTTFNVASANWLRYKITRFLRCRRMVANGWTPGSICPRIVGLSHDCCTPTDTFTIVPVLMLLYPQVVWACLCTGRVTKSFSNALAVLFVVYGAQSTRGCLEARKWYRTSVLLCSPWTKQRTETISKNAFVTPQKKVHARN